MANLIRPRNLAKFSKERVQGGRRGQYERNISTDEQNEGERKCPRPSPSPFTRLKNYLQDGSFCEGLFFWSGEITRLVTQKITTIRSFQADELKEESSLNELFRWKRERLSLEKYLLGEQTGDTIEERESFSCITFFFSLGQVSFSFDNLIESDKYLRDP